MKKFLSLWLVLAMVFVFTACGEKAAESAADDGALSEIVIADGLPTFSLGTDVNVYECDIPEGSPENQIHCYSVDKEGKQIVAGVFEYDNSGEYSLEELTKSEASDYEACWEMKQYQGVDCGYLCASYEKDGEWKYQRSWFFETEDKFYEAVIYYDTQEVQVADTDYYMWIPLFYEEAEIPEGTPGYVMSIFEDHAPEGSTIGEFAEINFVNYDWLNGSYEEEIEFYKEKGVEPPFTEEQFNGWMADGWTIDDIKELSNAMYDIEEEDIYSKDEYGVDFYLFEYFGEEDKVDYDYVRIMLKTDDGFVGIKLLAPVDEWVNQGSALANSIHVK